MIKYFYSEISLLSLDGEGGSFYRPVFFDYPNESGSYTNQEINVMLGRCVKLGIQSRATGTGTDTTDFYFPKGLWCQVNGDQGANNCINSTGMTKTLPSGPADYQLHLSEGGILPYQDVVSMGYEKIKTTQDLKKYPVEFHILPNCDKSSC
jgi:hypothetical protein